SQRRPDRWTERKAERGPEHVWPFKSREEEGASLWAAALFCLFPVSARERWAMTGGPRKERINQAKTENVCSHLRNRV
ncbi:hypothetical protein JZ751_022065, partial [Albula glossodonta]